MRAWTAAEQRELEILRELDVRRARASFQHYYQRMTGFTPERHHVLICRLLQRMEDDYTDKLGRRLDRAMIFMPPRMAKSTLCTQLFPSWIIGRHPITKLMSGVHTQKYAEKTGKLVRNYLRSSAYPFDVGLAGDSQAKSSWATNFGGEYNGFGLMGGSTHGNPAEWLVMDDLIKGRKMALSKHMREEAWETYKADLLTRLQGRSKQIMVTCMTGDTPVLLADGTEMPLSVIRPGQEIATYEDGKITTSRVTNWANKGADRIFTIRMTSGRQVRANARHPFLVEDGGVREWRRTATLRKGTVILTATGESGQASNALRADAIEPQCARGCARATTTRSDGQTATGQHRPARKAEGLSVCESGMESSQINMKPCSKSRVDCALCADCLQRITSEPIGVENSASTTAMKPERSGVCSATIATSWSDTERTQKHCCPALNTFVVTPDVIEDIFESGTEDVFDIEVERTENFIANGLVSHNTRWHEDDVCGRILPEGYDGRSGWYQDRETGQWWYVLSLAARAEHDRDPLGRKVGEYLVDFDSKRGDPFWENFEAQWKATERRGGYTWSALHQQRPAPEDGLLFQADHIKEYDPATLDLGSLQIYITSDYATTEEAGKADPDYTVHTVWGVDSEWNIYMLDMWRGRTLSNVWVSEWIRLVKQHRPLMAGEERGQILSTVGPFLAQQMRDEGAFVLRRQYPSVTSKEARAQSILGMAAMGKFWLPKGHPLTQIFRSELLSFPAGKHDDMVDTASLMGRMLADIVAGRRERGKKSDRAETLTELFLRNEAERD